MGTGKHIIYIFLCLVIFITQVYGQSMALPQTEVSFKKTQLLNAYITEGASIADLNMDGNPDIIAGSLWWKGPNFKVSYSIAPLKKFPITGPGLEGYATNFFSFPGHFDEDKITDLLQVGIPGTGSKWVKNPGETLISATETQGYPEFFEAQENICHESPNLIHVIGDEKKELLAYSNGKITLGIPSRNSKNDWEVLPVSPFDPDRFPVFIHGLGVGDINMDGYNDIVEKSGWWQQPENWDKKTPWKYHPYPFSPEQGGAQMIVYDVDGDKDNDVVTAMNAHSYGFSWHEQIIDNGSISFKEHSIMTEIPEGNKYGVSFSQLHALASADIDNDGILDVVTGKCYYAHNGRDPGSEDPAVLYWFKTKRNNDGTVDLIPYLIDNNSGVGRQISIGDLNKDGKMDIVTANKKGVHAFIQN